MLIAVMAGSTGMTPNRVMLVNFPPKPKRGKAKKT